MNNSLDDHLCAYLIPLSGHPKHYRIDLWRLTPECSFGRNPLLSNLVLPGEHISGKHAIISWNRRTGVESEVWIQDVSTGGTWVNGELVGKEPYRLEDKDEIGFGAPVVVPEEQGFYDFRYRFHHVAGRAHHFDFDQMYVTQSNLGSGTYGTVDLAVEQATNRLVAVKKMTYTPGRSCDHLKVIKDRLTEIRAMENIPTIYLVLQYMPGQSLLEFLGRAIARGGLATNIARDIMFQLCHAMAHCHALGITHRDLKPENILLRDHDDAKPFIKIADFGLSNIAKDVDSRDLMHTVCGSYAYMAPEVYTEEGYDYYADSFSGGILLFTMFTLQNPWVGDYDGHPPFPKMRWDDLVEKKLPGQAIDLLDHLVRFDAHSRVSLTGALAHPWMRAHTPLHPQVNYAKIPATR
ncbi:kinase-like domain-containing protein [Roridomyces roridus]|uniref:Kinase-like domain-containing protein n=1 Tax=Roridomyces roridus TaxID=1738132 RepID=A0AAD7BJM5_9AGAR|nr:kinase-like domain-containing protein [Roridomyces roridus]